MKASRSVFREKQHSLFLKGEGSVEHITKWQRNSQLLKVSFLSSFGIAFKVKIRQWRWKNTVTISTFLPLPYSDAALGLSNCEAQTAVWHKQLHNCLKRLASLPQAASCTNSPCCTFFVAPKPPLTSKGWNQITFLPTYYKQKRELFFIFYIYICRIYFMYGRNTELIHQLLKR